jgi:hypothetical protein
MTINDLAKICLEEMSNLKYCYESTISDCISSVAFKYHLKLTGDQSHYLKRKLVVALASVVAINQGEV